MCAIKNVCGKLKKIKWVSTKNPVTMATKIMAILSSAFLLLALLLFGGAAAAQGVDFINPFRPKFRYVQSFVN
jgi:hypothetical protein